MNRRKLMNAVAVVLAAGLTGLVVPVEGKVGRAGDGFVGQGGAVRSASAEGEEVLENGLVRVAFNRSSGQFEAYALENGAMRLFEAGPAFEKDGRKILAREAVKVETRHESFKDQIGEGEKLIVEYKFRESTPGFRYELRDGATITLQIRCNGVVPPRQRVAVF